MIEFKLGGNDQDTINSFACLCMLALLFAVALGFLLDAFLQRRADLEPTADISATATADAITNSGEKLAEVPFARRLPSASTVLLTLVSYGLLVPGLSDVLFSFNIMLDFGFIKFGIGPHAGLGKTVDVTESMFGLVRLLRLTHCDLGAHAVILYAMVIPSVKMCLFLLSLVPCCPPTAARWCTKIVQSISKWACPDMFAYILLMYLIRGLNHPRMLLSKMQLDLGFTYFSLFCIGSTAASLGMRQDDEGKKSSWLGRLVHTWIGGGGLAMCVAALMIAFCVFLHVGMTTPVMALRIHMEALYKPRGPIPTSFLGIDTTQIVDRLHLPEKANSDVSLMQALMSLYTWMRNDGEVNSGIGFVMIAVFVIFCTIADMVVLLLLAVAVWRNAPTERLQKFNRVIGKFAMLDVMVMGILVVTLCAMMYRKDGIYVTTQSGLVALGVAEALHYVVSFLVTSAVAENDFQRPPSPQYDKLQELSSPCEGGREDGV